MRVARLGVVLVAGLLMGSVVTSAVAETAEVTEFEIPSAGRVESVAVAFGSVWTLSDGAEPGSGGPPGMAVGPPVIYELDPQTGAVVDSHTVPTEGIGRLIAGPNYIWYALEGDGEGNPGEVVGRLDPDSGAFEEFNIGAGASASRFAILDDEFWFTDPINNRIGQLDPDTAQVTTYDIPTEGSLPVGLTVGFGYVWFAELEGRMIGRLDPATGGIVEYEVGDAMASMCCGMTTGFGAVWFTMAGDNRIGKVDPNTGSIVTYELPGEGSAFPIDIVAGPYDSVWFTQLNEAQVGRLDPATGSVVEYDLPTEESRPFGIAAGSVWVAEEAAGKIARITIDRFSDDNGSVFESDIEWLAAEGITKGCNPPENTLFCPNDFVTRGQMAAFLVRALGYTDSGAGDLFTDDDGSIFEDNIDKLATAGVTKGCNPPTNDNFCPNDNVTRGQMAAFLRRALG